MLLEGRFWILRFYLGVRVIGVIDETRETAHGPERVWGWCYQTLQGRPWLWPNYRAFTELLRAGPPARSASVLSP